MRQEQNEAADAGKNCSDSEWLARVSQLLLKVLEARVLGWSHVGWVLEVEDALAAPAGTVEVILEDLVNFHILLMPHEVETRWVSLQPIIWCPSFAESIAIVRSLEKIALTVQDDIACVKYFAQVDHSLIGQIFPIIIALHERRKTNFMRIIYPQEWQVAGLVLIGTVVQVESFFWEPSIFYRRVRLVEIAARARLCAHVVIQEELRRIIHVVCHFKHRVGVLVGLLPQLPRVEIAHEIERCVVYSRKSQY